MPKAKGFRVSPGLAIFIVALLGFSSLILFKGGKKTRRPATISTASKSEESGGYNEATSGRDRGTPQDGHTRREGFVADQGEGLGGMRLRVPGPGAEQGYPGRSMDAAHAPQGPQRSSTRVLNASFPPPSPDAPCCTLRVLSGSWAGTELPMNEQEITIGRERERNTYALPDSAVSSRHATLRWNAGIVTITDDNSTNGTRVGNISITPARPHPLQIGDQIQVGSTVLAVEAPRSAPR